MNQTQSQSPQPLKESQLAPDDLASRFHPDDGFRVRRVQLGVESLSLHLMFYECGVSVTPPWAFHNDADAELISVTEPNDEQFGQVARLEQIARAMCRFVNTGGSWRALSSLLGVFSKFSGGGHYTIPGYTLIGSLFNDDGNFESLFCHHKSGTYLKWVDGCYFETFSSAEMSREIQDAVNDRSLVTTITNGPIEPGWCNFLSVQH
jgi:hypothetical protein